MSERNIQSLGYEGRMYWKKGTVAYAETVFTWYQQVIETKAAQQEAILLPSINPNDPEVFVILRAVMDGIWPNTVGNTHSGSSYPVTADFQRDKIQATLLGIKEYLDDETIISAYEYIMEREALNSAVDEDEA